MTIEHNAPKIAADLRLAGMAALPAAIGVTRTYGEILKRRVQANASGRPGPRVQTGDYRRSWSSELAVSAGSVEAVVGSNKPQARRLELGYIGADSLGRNHSQPPFPHAGPALDATGPEYLDALSTIVGWAI